MAIGAGYGHLKDASTPGRQDVRSQSRKDADLSQLAGNFQKGGGKSGGVNGRGACACLGGDGGVEPIGYCQET